MKQIIILFTLSLSVSAYSTAYIYGYESESRSYGAIVLTSGPINAKNRIIDVRKRKGLFGWGGSVHQPNKRKAIVRSAFKMFKKGKNNKEIESYIFKKNGGDSRYSRLGFINPNEGIGIVLPTAGCSRSYGECGLRKDHLLDRFAILGGGLKENVLDKTKSFSMEIFDNNSIPLACKLLLSGLYLAKVGGEQSEFGTAQLVVDDSSSYGLLRVDIYTSERLSETEILKQLRIRLLDKGVECPAI